jgi:hypothetical protein
MHDEIVKIILPRLAKKLKSDGMISDYGRKQEAIRVIKDFREIKVNPDLVLDLSNGKRILVEVANLREPKRFIGELMYPAILLSHKRIVAALVFVLTQGKQERQSRSLSQIIALHDFSIPKGLITIGWSSEDDAY